MASKACLAAVSAFVAASVVALIASCYGARAFLFHVCACLLLDARSMLTLIIEKVLTYIASFLSSVPSPFLHIGQAHEQTNTFTKANDNPNRLLLNNRCQQQLPHYSFPKVLFVFVSLQPRMSFIACLPTYRLYDLYGSFMIAPHGPYDSFFSRMLP